MEILRPLTSRRWTALVLVLLTLSLVPVPGRDAAEASCAAPYLVSHGEQPVLTPGQDYEVEGRAFVHGCDDTGAVAEGPLGCSSSEQREQETPMSGVPLLLKQGGEIWRLAAADAGQAADQELGQVTWSFGLPAGVRSGRAVLISDVPPTGVDPFDARLVVRVAP